MRIGPSKHSKGGELRWSFYTESGESALMSFSDIDGSPELTCTVALWPPSPRAPEGYVWLKGWEANEGVPQALEDAGVVVLTGTQEPTGFCHARLAKLTPDAIADRDAQMDDDMKAAKAEAWAKASRETRREIHL